MSEEAKVVKYVGVDCPECGKKGTVFRCPRRSPGLKDDYICINHTLGDGEGCVSFTLHKDKINWDSTPEIHMDLYDTITSLYQQKQFVDTIRNVWDDMMKSPDVS